MRIQTASFVSFFLLLVSPLAAQTIRSQAVIDLPLDSNTKLTDVSKAGKHSDVASIKGTRPQLISSPFWNQKGKALILDAGGKQYIDVPDSPDTDQPKAVTVSTFFVNLLPLTDAGYHGVFGKRGPNNDARTNYGINFQMLGDVFQLYVHDGAGFKVAGYSAKQTIGFSKLVHLTASWEIADAPGSDADKDADDMRIRLFINGKIVKPTRSSAGFVSGNDAWLVNVNAEKILNDVPLTIGSSFGDQELTTGVYDEFLLFNKALTPDEVGKLFVELAGATADQIARRDQQRQQKQTTKPTIASITPRGLRSGGTTRITVLGSQLDNGSLFLGDKTSDVKVVETKGNRLVADVTLPKETTPGFYPLRVHNRSGMSAPAIITIDRLQEFTVSQTRPDQPAKLPGAFSGTIAGTQEQRVWFAGKKGQRVVADVECRRLAGMMEPVVEIKNARGTPLAIEWRKHQFHGDTRAIATLPADGTYSVELHDLAYKAPGNTPFRIRLGDLKVVDRFLPSGSSQNWKLAAVGPGVSKLKMSAQRVASAGVKIDGAADVDGPLPPLSATDAEQISEVDGKVPVVDATFTGPALQKVIAVNGTLSKPREQDVINLKVTEGQKLYFGLKSRSLGSPMDGLLRVLNGKQQLGAKGSGGTGNNLALEVVVPKGVKTLQARVSDFTKSGSPAHAYRLLVSRSGRVDFRIAAKQSAIEIPENGSAALRLTLTRAGGGFAYAGPIRLAVEGDSGVEITPTELPQEAGNRDVYILLTRTEKAADNITPLRITATTTRGPVITRAVTVPTTTPVMVASFAGTFASGSSEPVDATINVAGVPPILFRGTEAQLPLQITSLSETPVGAVRFKLLSGERVRPNKPLVRVVPNQFLTAGQSTSDLRMTVPLDQIDRVIDFVVVGELVENPFSPVARATIYSAPIRMSVQTAVRIAPAATSLSLKIGTKPVVSGRVIRRFGFAEPIRLTLAGLPKGYAAAPVVVPANGSSFAIPVTLPKDAKPMDIKAQLVIQTASGATIANNQSIALKVAR